MSDYNNKKAKFKLIVFIIYILFDLLYLQFKCI